MWDLIEAVLIAIPLAVAAGRLLVRARRGDGPNQLTWVTWALLAAGGGVWWAYGADPDSGLPWFWAIGLVIATIAVPLAWRPRWASRALVVTAILAPVVSVAYTSSLYIVGTGVSDGRGGQEGFVEMLPVSLMVAALYSAPALITWVVLRDALRPPVPIAAAATAPPAGWFPDPGDPSQQRQWDGTRWTDRTRPADSPHDVGA